MHDFWSPFRELGGFIGGFNTSKQASTASFTFLKPKVSCDKH